MGKGGDIWDDSALIRAFDDAVSKYKRMHGRMAGNVTDENLQETFPAPEADGETNGFSSNLENSQNDDNTALASVNSSGRNASHFETIENPYSGVGSSIKHVEPSCMKTGKLEPSVTHDLGFSSDAKNKDEAACYPNSQEEYNQLLGNYYYIEYQRQNILQLLHQHSYWNDQNPAASTSYPESTQVSAQPYASVRCNCSYGCQNWVVPCNPSSAPCIGNSHVDKGITMPQDTSDIAKTAMDAARKAMSSLKLESANEGKDNEVGPFIDNVSENSVAGTDLAVVLNAWYNAGFYTGKYLSEQSFEKRKHG